MIQHAENDVGDSGMSSLSEALKVNSCLTSLEMEISSKEMCCIFIYVFHFTCNNVGDSGASSLSSALEINSTLTSFDLRVSFIK